MPSAVTAGTFDASSSSRGSTGHVHELARVPADEHEHRAEPGRLRLLDQLEPARGIRGEHRRRAMAERRGRRALGARLDLEQLQCELLALFRERACGRRKPFALGERLLERDEPLPCEAHAGLEIFLLAQRGAGRSVGVVGEHGPSSAGDGPAGTAAGLGQLLLAAPTGAAAPTRAGRRAAGPRRAARAARRGRRR